MAWEEWQKTFGEGFQRLKPAGFPKNEKLPIKRECYEVPAGAGNQIPLSKHNLRSCRQVYNPANEGVICSFSRELGKDFSKFLHKEEGLAPKNPKDLHQSDLGSFRLALFQPGWVRAQSLLSWDYPQDDEPGSSLGHP